ncbi:unnamed protein product [Nezara viridula]|uniref:peptidylprolyl isomerase n=1 Tax=Nezara viridula TaxID=85310 RepID=A0A9P0ML95_NEZVI|nr:unnamed protein product [Nezara viridula]
MGSMDRNATPENFRLKEEYTPSNNAVDVSPKKDGGVLKEIIRPGTSEGTPPQGCKVIVHYEGKLTDGTVFDSSKERSPFEFNLGKGNVIKAWDIGVATMRKGEIAILTCREDYAYGSAGSPPKIPPGATLIFEVELIDWEPENLSGKKDKGILRYPIKEGNGFDSPKESSNVEIRIKGEHEGRIFDERDVSFCLGEGIESDIPPGVEKGLEKFIKGETSRLELKPQYGFGAIGHENFGIPPNAHLTYTVTLKDFDPVVDIWMMSNEQKLEQSKVLKEKGTKYFKLEKYQLALKMYLRIVEILDYKNDFQGAEQAEAKSLLLAANLNISMCQLKLKNYLAVRKVCDKILEEDSQNVKGLFRRGQAYLGLNEPQLAKTDFEAVLAAEPENKAVPPQIAICNAKLKEIRSKEKKMYANMFEKFAQKDREWRFGWLEGEKPVVEIAPENPEILEERKRRKEEKRRYIEETRRLLQLKKEREEREKNLDKNDVTENEDNANPNKSEEIISCQTADTSSENKSTDESCM